MTNGLETDWAYSYTQGPTESQETIAVPCKICSKVLSFHTLSCIWKSSQWQNWHETFCFWISKQTCLNIFCSWIWVILVLLRKKPLHG